MEVCQISSEKSSMSRQAWEKRRRRRRKSAVVRLNWQRMSACGRTVLNFLLAIVSSQYNLAQFCCHVFIAYWPTVEYEMWESSYIHLYVECVKRWRALYWIMWKTRQIQPNQKHFKHNTEYWAWILILPAECYSAHCMPVTSGRTHGKFCLLWNSTRKLKWCAHRSKFYRTTNIYTAPFSNISAKLIYWNWIHPKRGYERHYEDGSNQCFIHIATPHHIISNGKSDCAQLICVMCIVYERRSSSIICNHANIQSTHTGIGHILC